MRASGGDPLGYGCGIELEAQAFPSLMDSQREPTAWFRL